MVRKYWVRQVSSIRLPERSSTARHSWPGEQPLVGRGQVDQHLVQAVEDDHRVALVDAPADSGGGQLA